MRIMLWGTRGSVASPGPETIRYGGNTSCVTIEGANGTILVLDAGTGIRRLSGSFPKGNRQVNLLLTHLHLDHIQGLGFFEPFLQSDNEVHIWGPASTTLTLQERLSRYLSPPLFPVYIRDMPASVHLHEITGDTFRIGEFAVSSALVCHPDPTVGYRIENHGIRVTYLPDHEPALGTRQFTAGLEWTSGYALAEGVDLLIHDAQYTPEEYKMRVGWGHSSIPQAFQFAALAGAKHLVPFHHDPMHSDDKLDQLFTQQIRTMQPAFEVTPGVEGAIFELK